MRSDEGGEKKIFGDGWMEGGIIEGGWNEGGIIGVGWMDGRGDYWRWLSEGRRRRLLMVVGWSGDYWRWLDGWGWGLLEVVEWRGEKKIIGSGLMELWRLLGGELFEVVGWRGEKRIIGGGWLWGGGLRRRLLKGLVGRG